MAIRVKILTAGGRAGRAPLPETGGLSGRGARE
jgi:hypothetical protein